MTGSFRAEERSFRVCRGGEGRPVATVMPVGGGGGSRVRGRESRGRGGGRGRVIAVRQLRGFVRGVPGDEEEAGGGQGSRRWRRGGARVSARAVPLSGRKTTEEGPGGLGRLLAGPACCGWAAQGGGSPR